jgi:hypothetical protein
VRAADAYCGGGEAGEGGIDAGGKGPDPTAGQEAGPGGGETAADRRKTRFVGPAGDHGSAAGIERQSVEFGAGGALQDEGGGGFAGGVEGED